MPILLRKRNSITIIYENYSMIILCLILVKKRIQLSVKDKQKKYYITASETLLITKQVQVQEILIKALIDYESLVNIILEKTVQENDLLIQKHSKLYQIVGISKKTFILGK